MLIDYQLTATSIILRVKVLNSSLQTGGGLTGVSSGSAGFIISATADNEQPPIAGSGAGFGVAYSGSNLQGIATLGTFAAPTAGKCRVAELDATNHKGVLEIQLDNTRYAVTGAKSLLVSLSGVTNMAECDALIPLRGLNPYDASAIPTAVFSALSEGAETFIQSFRLLRAAIVGKLSGAGTTSVAIRDAADSKNRITATVDSAGNRTAVTTDGT